MKYIIFLSSFIILNSYGFFADAIPGLAGVFASLATLGTIAIDLVPCTLMVAIVVMCAIAKTTPFVTQPTESALAHRDSSVKSNALFFCLKSISFVLIYISTYLFF